MMAIVFREVSMSANAITLLDVKNITIFDATTTEVLVEMLKEQSVRLGQLHRLPKDRTLTARNYNSGMNALGIYMTKIGFGLPTKSILIDWRDSMIAEGKSVRTANARLAAARKLLRAV